MRIVGLDLSGKQSNPTGYCLLDEKDGKKQVQAKILHSDGEILEQLLQDKPSLVAQDAPIIYAGVGRGCDLELSRYGALPVTLPGMTYLAERGRDFAEKAGEKGFECIEVNVKSSSRILGVYHKDDYMYQKNILSLDFDGELTMKLLSRDELDSIIAAITGYLHLIGSSKIVGDETGKVIIPEI